MNSNSLIQNFKYYGKFLIIILVTFLLLKFIINLKLYEAILLALIITVSILIIENLIYINDIATDPLNCDQCKVNLLGVNGDVKTETNIINNTVQDLNLLTESEQESEVKETFVSNSLEKIINGLTTTIKKDTNELLQQNNDVFEFKCIKINKNKTQSNTEQAGQTGQAGQAGQAVQAVQAGQTGQSEQLEDLKKKVDELQKNQQNQQNLQNPHNPQNPQNQQNPLANGIIEGFNNIDSTELEHFINNQQNQNKNMANKLKSQPKIQATNKIKNTINQQDKTNTGQVKINPNLNSNLNQDSNSNSEYNLNSPITYDDGYVQYQQDGLQKQENDVSLDIALLRMGMGQENIVKPFVRDGSSYYNKIKSYSSKAPTSSEALNSELRYGDYNYISPINSGMTNSDYTFISPNNWYPIPPHPPVCVTNKQCTTCPIQITDGKDYMHWATLEDFDKSRRFTGNMGINIDYVKNVLNNDEGY